MYIVCLIFASFNKKLHTIQHIHFKKKSIIKIFCNIFDTHISLYKIFYIEIRGLKKNNVSTTFYNFRMVTGSKSTLIFY